MALVEKQQSPDEAIRQLLVLYQWSVDSPKEIKKRDTEAKLPGKKKNFYPIKTENEADGDGNRKLGYLDRQMHNWHQW